VVFAKNYISQEFSNEGVLELTCEGKENILCQLYNRFTAYAPDFDLKQAILDNINTFITKGRSALAVITTSVLDFFISLYIFFFLLLDGKKLVNFIKDIMAMKPSYEKYMTETLKDTVNGVVFGSLVIAVIQGFLAGIGYWLIGGVGAGVLLGVLTAFAALIPNIGTLIVWAPVSVFVFMRGIIQDTGSDIVRGILLFAYGALFISTIDNILKPKIIGDRAKIHPVVVLLGVLGGLKFMGFIGVMVGPLILALFISFVKLLKLERRNL
jgi:predicted PurR-regulated permease PerM